MNDAGQAACQFEFAILLTHDAEPMAFATYFDAVDRAPRCSCENPSVITRLHREMLDRAPLLAHLDSEHRDAVMAAGSVHRHARGAILFHEGDAADAMFVLLSGLVKLIRYNPKGREMLLHLVHPGQSFAEAALFGDRTFPATAEALEDLAVWRVGRVRLVALVQATPELGLALAGSVSRWTRRLATQLELQTQRRVEERLAIYLLSRVGERSLDTGDTIPLAEPRHLIAAQCGTAPEVLSRTFRRLEEDGVLRVGPRSAEVLEPVRLRQLAEWIGE